jgi:hypothetical protein
MAKKEIDTFIHNPTLYYTDFLQSYQEVFFYCFLIRCRSRHHLIDIGLGLIFQGQKNMEKWPACGCAFPTREKETLRVMGLSEKQWIDRGWYLVSDFIGSSSAKFSEALELARTLEGFVELCDENGGITYRNFFRRHNISQFKKLYTIIGKWKTTRIYINGHERPDLPAGVECMMEQEDCSRSYPDNPKIPDFIGCVRQNIRFRINSDFPSGPEPLYWFEYSSYKGNGRFSINKNQIKEIYLATISHPHYRDCPLFDKKRDLALIASLPDSLEISEATPHWRLRKVDESTSALVSSKRGQNQATGSKYYPFPDDPAAYQEWLEKLPVEQECAE